MNTLRSVGYDKVGPEYVINEAQAKRAKNNGELDRIIVEGKHQPIVTKEEFERVQRMLEEKTHRRRSGGKIKASIRMTSGEGSCGASADTLSQRPGGTPSQGTSPPTPTGAMTRPGRGRFRHFVVTIPWSFLLLLSAGISIKTWLCSRKSQAGRRASQTKKAGNYLVASDIF